MSGKNKSKSSHVFNTKKRAQNKRTPAKLTTVSKTEVSTAAAQDPQPVPSAFLPDSLNLGEDVIQVDGSTEPATIEPLVAQWLSAVPS